MKQVIFLDNGMFDDGSIECKTFCVADKDDALVCEYSYIEKHYPEHVDAIKDAIKNGKHYIGIGVAFTSEYKEIQWD